MDLVIKVITNIFTRVKKTLFFIKDHIRKNMRKKKYKGKIMKQDI